VSHHTSERQVKLAAKKCQKHRFHRTILPFATETSYGKQPGRISDALIVLLKHVELVGTLSPDEEAAIRDLKSMLNEIANKKATHGAKLVLRPPA
jgi:hypothetical protein